MKTTIIFMLLIFAFNYPGCKEVTNTDITSPSSEITDEMKSVPYTGTSEGYGYPGGIASRFDGRDQLLSLGLGGVFNQNKMAPQLTAEIWVRDHQTTISEHLYLQKATIAGKSRRVANLARLTNLLVKIPSRNDFVLDFVLKAAKANRRVMVFSARINHLEHLKKRFDDTLGPGKSAMFIGGLSSSEREAAKKLPVMFCTYQYCKEALDDPDRDSIIMATPVTAVRQVIGRILRTAENKKTPFVVDIVDKGVKKLELMASSRAKEYKSMKPGMNCPLAAGCPGSRAGTRASPLHAGHDYCRMR